MLLQHQVTRLAVSKYVNLLQVELLMFTSWSLLSTDHNFAMLQFILTMGYGCEALAELLPGHLLESISVVH